MDKVKCYKCKKMVPVKSFGGSYVAVCLGCDIVLYNSRKKPKKE